MSEMYPLVELGGSGPVINLALANGFPPETYLPMLRPLMESYRVVCLLPRAMWGGQVPPDPPRDWKQDITSDLLVGIEHHNLHDVIAMGHSFGGIASALAVKNRPEAFRALILLDPTILDPALLAELARLRASNAPSDAYPLAARALRRQDVFAHRSEAFEYFRSRGVFKDWNHAALSQYVDSGLVQTEAGFVLAWPKEWEAYYFRTVYLNFWDEIPALNGLRPTLIVRGATSETYMAESAAAVARLWPDAAHVEIPGAGHLFPQTAPEQASEVLKHWLSTAL